MSESDIPTLHDEIAVESDGEFLPEVLDAAANYEDTIAVERLERFELADTRANLDLAQHFGEDIGGKVDEHAASLFARINQRVEEGMLFLQAHDMLPKTKKGFWALSAVAAPAVVLLPGGVAIGAGLFKLYQEIKKTHGQDVADTQLADLAHEGDTTWFKQLLHNLKPERTMHAA